MKLFKNIVSKRKYGLKRILLLGCIFCAIISYNIGFSNKVFGGILDGSLVDANTPSCGYMATIKGENYFGGCSTEQYNDCTNGNVILDWLTRLLYNGFGYETQCIKQCSENNVVEFTGQLTNEDVLVTLTGCNKPVTVTNNSGSNQYLFTENGVFTFEFVDNNGRTGETFVKINGINRIDPECNIFYEPSILTSGNVVATLTGCNKKLTGTITSHIFTGNGTFVFELEDVYGNTGTEIAKVTWIDKEKPTCDVDFNPSSNTTGDVLAILTGCSEKITESETMFLFTDNGSYTFRYQDLVGNTGATQATVNWILSNDALTGITHTINDNIITLTWEKTDGYNGDVDFYLWNEDNKEYSLLGTTGLERESFSFEAQGEGGHMIKIVPRNGGNIKYYSVSYGNTHPTITPICEIEYPDPDKKPTNQDVIVKLTNCNEKVYVTNTDGGNVFHTFSDKGTFTFEFRDDYGNTGETTATVDWIDKLPPRCMVSYSDENTTRDPVTARISNCSEEIHFSDGYGDSYTFNQNGRHIFYFLDNVGNIGTAEANVSWITGDNELEISYAITGINHMENDGDIIMTWDVMNGKYMDIWLSYNGNEYILLDENINVNDQRYSFRNLGTGNYSIKFMPQNNVLGSIYTFDISDNDNNGNDNNGNGNGGDEYEEIICQITYSPSSPTSGDVIATLTGCNKEIVIDSFTHTFTENGTYIFNYVDTDGNPGQKIAEVDWIDKTAPQCTISYSTTQTTNRNVNATISCDDKDIIIKNNDHAATRVFSGNGEFIFQVSDLVGNTVSVLAKVSCIDKQAPTCDIAYSTRQQTTGEVFATLTNCSEQVLSVPGYSLYHRFVSNGSYSIIFRDMAGNLGSTRAEVDWIVIDNENHDNNDDETGAATTPEYPITGVNHFIYNGEIRLTWTALTSGYMDISIIKNDTSLRIGTIHTYSELFSIEPISSYRVSFTPLDSNLRTVYYDINIPDDPVEPDPGNLDEPDDPINPDPGNPDEPDDPTIPVDDDIPTCDVSYSTEQETHEAVIATLYDCSEEVTPLVGYSFSYVFTDNGNHMFYFVDNNGNIGTARASVNWITHNNNEQNVNSMLTGVSHAISGNKIKLTWTALSPGVVEIYLWDAHSKEYGKIGSTNINNEEFLVDITRSGEYLFKLDPVDGDATIYFIYVDTYTGVSQVSDCEIKYDYIRDSVVAILTGCDNSISITNNGGSARHVFDDGENMFTFEIKDAEGNIGNISAYIWFSENFDHYNNNLLGNSHIMLGNPANNNINNYILFYSDIPFKGSFTITGNNILLDNGAVLESNMTCSLYTGNNLTINIDGLGSKSVRDIIVSGDYAGFMSYELPKSYYINNILVNFGLNISTIGGGFCLIDDVSIISKPNTVISTKKTGAKTGTYYKSHNIEISGLPENTAIPIYANIDYTDTIIRNYGKCIDDDVSNINYCDGKYITDIVLYKNGEVVSKGETVGQNGDVFSIKIKSSVYENSNITANLMFGHTKKSIISQFSVSTFTGENMHGSADFEYDYSSFDPNYEFEWNEAYQYSYFYGITTQSPIANADMHGNLNRIAMAKMLSKYATNILGYKIDSDKECKFSDVTKARDNIYDNGATNACKLGIMGINMPNNEFRPYDLVTRAEFATALSRLLYGTKDGKDVYYSTHIAKLKAENIITDTNPNLIEKRGYVMLMLMRSKR